MQVKRFVAADMRRALELVRQEMGPDAIILSSHRRKEGVEVLTTLESEPSRPPENLQINTDSETGLESPLLSDGAWGSQIAVNSAVNERRGQDPSAFAQEPSGFAQEPSAFGQEPSAFGQKLSALGQEPSVGQAFSSQATSSGRGLASGKTHQELADEMERARTRMMASRKTESLTLGQMAGSAQSEPQASVTGFPAAAPAAVSPAMAERQAEPMNGSRQASIEERAAQLAACQKIPSPQGNEQYKAVGAAKLEEDRSEEDHKLSAMQSELADMRELLEQQLEQMSFGQSRSQTPLQAGLNRRLNRLGFSDGFSAQVINGVRKQGTLAKAWPETLATLSHQIPVKGQDVVAQGGVFAFVGPSGVGKTTTIGKLAARYVLEHGAEQVALVTTDTCRIAAHDQLRSFGRILNVAVRVVDDTQSLPAVLHSLRHHSLVLIDTAGLRHGDPYLKQQLEALSQQPQIQNYLVLASNSQQQMMKASVHAFKAAGLSGCILTKLDETESLGEAIDVITQQKLPVAYTTDGQDIPQDIEVARAHNLVSKAVALTKNQLVSQGVGS